MCQVLCQVIYKDHHYIDFIFEEFSLVEKSYIIIIKRGSLRAAGVCEQYVLRFPRATRPPPKRAN